MPKPRRVRYFAGPEVWTLAQEAYLRGESAASIAARLNLTVNGLRKRAARKGWTRTQHAAALQRRERPAVALQMAVAEAGRALARGDVEAAALAVRTAEGLARAVRAAPASPLSPEETAALWAKQAEWRRAERARLELEARDSAERMAEGLLTGRLPAADLGWSLAALRWRARTLGPEAALADYASAVQGGWAARCWDAQGRLLPPQTPPAPERRMHAQAVAAAQGVDWTEADLSDAPWPPTWAVVDEASSPEPEGPRVRTL